MNAKEHYTYARSSFQKQTLRKWKILAFDSQFGILFLFRYNILTNVNHWYSHSYSYENFRKIRLNFVKLNTIARAITILMAVDIFETDSKERGKRNNVRHGKTRGERIAVGRSRARERSESHPRCIYHLKSQFLPILRTIITRRHLAATCCLQQRTHASGPVVKRVM